MCSIKNEPPDFIDDEIRTLFLEIAIQIRRERKYSSTHSTIPYDAEGMEFRLTILKAFG